jgi:hypothetical protein
MEMLARTKIAFALALILGAAGAAEASTMDQAFTMAQASTGLGTIGRPGTNTFAPQPPRLGAPSGVNPANPQDMTNRGNPQDMTVPRARNPQDLTR